MIDDSAIGDLQKGMDTSDVAMTDVTAEVARDFLLSLFDLEGKSDQKVVRNADAIKAVQQWTFDVSSQSLQSNITEILTKLVLLSQEGHRRASSRRLYKFKDVSKVSGCREEDAIEFLLFAFAKCDNELEKTTTSDHSKSTIETIKTAIVSVFINMQIEGKLGKKFNACCACLVFVGRLLKETVSCTFLRSLLEHCDEEAVNEVFNPIFEVLRDGYLDLPFKKDSDDISRDILRVMNTLLTIRLNDNDPPPLCKVLTSRPDFLPTELFIGRKFAEKSYLGPFFLHGLDLEHQAVNLKIFDDMGDEARKHSALIEQMQYLARLSSIRHGLHQLIHPIAAEAATRNILMKWMATFISVNHQRSRAQYDAAETVDDHFMANFMANVRNSCMGNFLSVMYRLTEEIDLAKIQMEYPFLPDTLTDITKETRLKMDESVAAAFSAQYADHQVEHDFSSVCFFLTMAAQKLFFPPLIRTIVEYSRKAKDAKKRVDRTREKLQNCTRETNRKKLEQELKQKEKQYKNISLHLLCVKTEVMDPTLQASAFDFAAKQLKIVMKALCADLNLMGDDSQFPQEPTQLFCAYPEHYLEDVLDFYTYSLQFAPEILMERATEAIQQSTVIFSHYEYVKSPYLVSKLVRLLATLQPPLWYNVVNLRMSQQRLLNAMIKFYSDFEDSGEFYEKYNVRGNIQDMLKKMGDDMYYKAKFMDMARECGPEFIRFVNMVINDATWCIDESLSGLKGVHEIERKMAQGEQLNNQDLGQLDEAENKVTGWLGTAKSNLELLFSITENSPEPFRTPALGERLAAMLNHNLSQLLGSNRQDFLVKDPASYGWKPREFVSLLINIYLGLHVPAFIKFIAYDERTYTPTFFSDSIAQLKQKAILGFSVMERFENLAEDVKKEYDAKALLEEEYDDVPEEFKDPIMDAIMEDPVKLPSGHVMDRAVIERHLLSTPNNPFNRAPLTQAELVPDVELKAKLEEWKIQKRNSKK
ncbi:hypothetical protein CAEBREN_11846 [Caenorhabditis brenneri]|uniref:RING-type E3 ubiquitin transferase n=1 Tax=Caenorhabditis brenneri TaxID=135651 RepID=G0NY89_CAEBE|nr:hypothetical protein CAEBREN_11846 [Caenorhabditis brenneri]